MKLTLERFSAIGTPSTATTSHRDQQITWNVQLFEKASISDEFDIFEQINAYWAQLPMSEQDKIFDVYTRIAMAFEDEDNWDNTRLTMALYGLIHDLFELHPIDSLRHWLDYRANLIMPSSVKKTFGETNAASNTVDRTYVVEDYRGLVTLSVALRIMIPIWGRFISRTREDAGTAFKEYYAFQLLSQSNIFHSTPMERLRVYVEKSLPQDKSMAPAILRGGLSSEDYPTWMLGLVLVRRLCVGDVRGIDPNSSLVTFIYKYIDQKAKGQDNTFNGQVKDKLIGRDGQEGDNNLSKLEDYKIKQEIPAGDTALIEHYVKDIYNMAIKLAPDIDVELVRLSEQSTRQLIEHQIWRPQMALMQWILKPVLSPRGLMYLNLMHALHAMAAAQAVLWHRGYKDLAALLSAIELESDDASVLRGSPPSKISKDQLEMLDKLYPYARRPPGRGKASAKRVNPAVEAIESVSTEFSQHAWKLSLPAEWAAEVTGNRNTRRYPVPADIRNRLATLTIAIQQRSF